MFLLISLFTAGCCLLYPSTLGFLTLIITLMINDLTIRELAGKENVRVLFRHMKCLSRMNVAYLQASSRRMLAYLDPTSESDLKDIEKRCKEFININELAMALLDIKRRTSPAFYEQPHAAIIISMQPLILLMQYAVNRFDQKVGGLENIAYLSKEASCLHYIDPVPPFSTFHAL